MLIGLILISKLYAAETADEPTQEEKIPLDSADQQIQQSIDVEQPTTIQPPAKAALSTHLAGISTITIDFLSTKVYVHMWLVLVIIAHLILCVIIGWRVKNHNSKELPLPPPPKAESLEEILLENSPTEFRPATGTHHENLKPPIRAGRTSDVASLHNVADQRL